MRPPNKIATDAQHRAAAELVRRAEMEESMFGRYKMVLLLFFYLCSVTAVAADKTVHFSAPICTEPGSIIDIQVYPYVSCLKVPANNCHGGVLEVYNGCREGLVIGNLKIPPRKRTDGPFEMELVKQSTGTVVGLATSGGIASYKPSDPQERLAIDARVGASRFTLSYTKTKLKTPSEDPVIIIPVKNHAQQRAPADAASPGPRR